MFIHSFKNTFKFFFRQKELLFWSLLFPIILGLFFKLAFANLTQNTKFKTIDVAVNESLMEDKGFESFMKEMEDEKYFNITKTDDDNILAKDDNLKAYIATMDDIYTKGSGISESVVETIMNIYKQKMSLIENIMMKDPTTDLSKITGANDYIKDVSRKNMDPVNIFFYTLIGMTAIYGYMYGLYVSFQYEGNLSVIARRNLVSPIKKNVAFSASVLVSWIMNFGILLVFIVYLKYALGVDFGDRTLQMILLAALATFNGVTLGILIGVSNKASIEMKTGLGIAISMLMSFLAGMMVPDIKILIAEYAPIINKINPVAVVTDAIYSLYYYDTLTRFNMDMINLLIITVVFIFAALFFMRGKEYESL